VLLLTWLACVPELKAPGVLANPAHDFDHDGFSEDEGDCDDSNPMAHPDAPELCNGLDDDCDGVIDEPDAIDALTFWLDTDGDGYGTTAVPACSQPPTTSILAGDCDDGSPTVHPGAVEDCNGVDDDCDGTTDEEDAEGCSVFYEDLDRDGYGTDLQACLCSASGAYSTPRSGDCDDGAEAVSPDAAEVCGNGIDDDCDGLEVASCFTETVHAEDAELFFEAEEGGDMLGHATLLRDLNGDGDHEVVLGAPNHEDVEPQSGRVYVLEGPIHDRAEDGVVPVDEADFVWDGTGLNHRVGSSLAVFHHGGATQLVIGALGEDTRGELAGATYLIEWPASGSGALEDIADRTLYGNGAGDKAGGWVCNVGDVDGDGRSDLVVGAGRATYDFDREGAAYLITDWTDSGVVGDVAALAVTGESDWSATGAAMNPGGDLDGDGLADLVLGAYQHDETAMDNGAAYVVPGTARGLHRIDEVALVRIVGDGEDERMGVGMTGDVDLDGDEQADLVIAASRDDEGGDEAGIIYAFYGPITGQLTTEDADIVLWGDRQNQHAGGAMMGAGDFDGVGPDELLIHAENAYYLAHTPLMTERLVRDISTMIEGESEDHLFGSDIDLGDVTRDGVPDLLIGASSHNDQGLESGAAYLFHGSAW